MLHLLLSRNARWHPYPEHRIETLWITLRQDDLALDFLPGIELFSFKYIPTPNTILGKAGQMGQCLDSSAKKKKSQSNSRKSPSRDKRAEMCAGKVCYSSSAFN